MQECCNCVEVNRTKAFVGAWMVVGLTLVTIACIVTAGISLTCYASYKRDVEMSKSGMVQQVVKTGNGPDEVIWVRK